MQNLKEDVFVQLFRAGAIRSVTVSIQNDRATVGYVTGDGVQGSIFTKRGDVKHYRIDTALRFLRETGLHSVQVDMQFWHLQQGSLV